jgi:hypothetical protein
VAIECTDILPYVITPLIVSVNHKGKERLILDLRHVNQYIEKRKHKFEGVSEAIQYNERRMFKCRTPQILILAWPRMMLAFHNVVN